MVTAPSPKTRARNEVLLTASVLIAMGLLALGYSVSSLERTRERTCATANPDSDGCTVAIDGRNGRNGRNGPKAGVK